MISNQQVDITSQYSLHKKAIIRGGSVAKHVSSMFNPEAQVLFVGSGILANGTMEIERVLGDYSKSSHLILGEKIISTISAKGKVVEESIISIDHSESISWLLPNVKPTGKEIIVLMVTISSFDAEGKLLSKKMYWDQASVLRQIGVLPRSLYSKAVNSEVILPVAGVDMAYKSENIITDAQAYSVAEALEDVKVNEDKEEESESKLANTNRGHSSDIFNVSENEHAAFRPSSRVLAQPGGKTSNIFGTSPDPALPKSEKAHFRVPESKVFGGEIPQIHAGKAHFEHVKDGVFDDSPIDSPKFNRRDPNWLTGEEIAQKPARPVSKDSNKSHFSLADAGSEVDYSSGRRIYQNASNQSGFSLAQNDEAIESRRTSKRDPNARSQELEHRPSSRVLAHPGGKSNFSFA